MKNISKVFLLAFAFLVFSNCFAVTFFNNSAQHMKYYYKVYDYSTNSFVTDELQVTDVLVPREYYEKIQISDTQRLYVYSAEVSDFRGNIKYTKTFPVDNYYGTTECDAIQTSGLQFTAAPKKEEVFCSIGAGKK